MIEYDLKIFLAINLEVSKIDNSIKNFAKILCSYSLFIELSFPSELAGKQQFHPIFTSNKGLGSFDTN